MLATGTVRSVMVDFDKVSDPNAEYTMRDLSAETMGIDNERGGTRDAKITGSCRRPSSSGRP